jgi:methyl-accepting chemotaxis protein
LVRDCLNVGTKAVDAQVDSLAYQNSFAETHDDIATSDGDNILRKLVFTIRLRLMLAFGACTTFMFFVGLLGILALRHVEASADSPYRWFLVSLIVFSWMGCGVAICSGLHIQRLVCGKLNRMGRKFEEIARTLDLSKRSSSPSMDEFGRSAVAFDKLMRRIEETVSTVRSSSDSVATATREIAAGNFDLSARTEKQASSLEKTASGVTQLTESVKQSADNASHAKALAMDAAVVATTGNDLVQAMVATIERIGGSSNKISEITGVIEGIAFQTNILALNAAVEAARAGEQGRGFAVVASEVRSLAQRSASAAKEIKELIASSVATIQDGSQQAIEVSTAMRDIESAIKRVSDFISEIAGSSEEQSRGIEQINQAIIQIDHATQQNAALVEQAAAAAQSLEEQATNLNIAVCSFKLADKL